MPPIVSDQILRRVLDVGISLLGLLLLFPLLCLVALAVTLTSPGPFIFVQTRVGKHGKLFRILKFRTMTTDASSKGPGVTQKSDNRMTPIGRFLRATKTDELPQLVNVLRGDMSLVGPRPEIPELVATYSEDLKNLLSVRPGITSPASVLCRREEENIPEGVDIMDFHRRVLVPLKGRLDLDYLERRTILSDLLVIIASILPFADRLINKPKSPKESGTDGHP